MQEKTILIKLGGRCNLSCKHCHCYSQEFEFNPDIIEYIKTKAPTKIVFSGGEPLLYFETMKHVISNLGQHNYHFVTNGVLLQRYMIEFLRYYDVNVVVSFDGMDSQRTKCDPKFKNLAKLPRHGLAITCYNENMNFEKIFREVGQLQYKNDLCPNYPARGFVPNFVHQTASNPNEQITKETAKMYIVNFCKCLEHDFYLYQCGGLLSRLAFLQRCIDMYSEKNYTQGVRCCSPNKLNVALDGRLMLCPYGNKYVGNIYSGVDWALVDSCIPVRCRACTLWSMCGNTCVANITEHECYIFKNIYRHYLKLLDKYKVEKV